MPTIIDKKSFVDEITRYRDMDLDNLINGFTPIDIERVLSKKNLSEIDYLALLSPAAEPHLEKTARSAKKITVQNFGNVVSLYTPLYLSDFCINQCLYCGFNVSNSLIRKKLTLDEVEREAQSIAETGLKHILILTGESRKHSPVSYIKDCVTILHKYFTSISIEIYPLDEDEYTELIAAGVDGVTIYQEVYNPEIYSRVHISGPKSNYNYRLETPDRASRAGIRTINIGALLGLDKFYSEALFTGIHAAYLQKTYPEIEVSISIPRLQPHLGDFTKIYSIDDKKLVQYMLAIRLFLPRVGIALSTRESAVLRDNLINLGVTKISAGSTTVVGGHTSEDKRTAQFEISDNRSVEQMKKLLLKKGYQPVLKDWQTVCEI